MNHMKKLQDFFVDEKVPASQRPHVPLVLDQRGIVWVGGLRPSEDARLRTSSTRALVLLLE
jgi:tRNA(Ile)-lysidine synthase